MKKTLYLLGTIGLVCWTLVAVGCGVDLLNPGGKDDKEEGQVDLSALDIHDGIGVGGIELGKSGMEDIRRVYGEPDFENVRGVHFFNRYGLRFMVREPGGIFYASEFTSPYKGRTLLGVANGDLRTKIITSYGAPDDFTPDSEQLDFVTSDLGLGGLKPENLLSYDRAGVLFVITDSEIVSSIFIFNRFLLSPTPSPTLPLSPSPTPILSSTPTPIPSPTPTPSPAPTSPLSLLGIDDGLGVGEIRVDGTTPLSKVEEIYGPPEATKVEPGLKELSYSSVGVFFFTDEADMVQSVSFASPYQGGTKLGIKLGNRYNLVWGLYGYPEGISEGNDHYYCKGISFAYDSDYKVKIILIYAPSCASSGADQGSVGK